MIKLLTTNDATRRRGNMRGCPEPAALVASPFPYAHHVVGSEEFDGSQQFPATRAPAAWTAPSHPVRVAIHSPDANWATFQWAHFAYALSLVRALWLPPPCNVPHPAHTTPSAACTGIPRVLQVGSVQLPDVLTTTPAAPAAEHRVYDLMEDRLCDCQTCGGVFCVPSSARSTPHPPRNTPLPEFESPASCASTRSTVAPHTVTQSHLRHSSRLPPLPPPVELDVTTRC
ncbi:hypothetical protein B0H11DRAFT_2221996 [Mycena galericulata]|nr:hypothetical protein B0H11DRAFT_2221996 [Mycena galericulata]